MAFMSAPLPWSSSAAFESWIQSRQPHYVCVTPAHSVMECYDHPDLRHIYNRSGLTTPDGMAIVWLMRAKGFRFVERVYGPDLMLAVCQFGIEKGYRHYFYGAAPGVAEKLACALTSTFSGFADCWHRISSFSAIDAR